MQPEEPRVPGKRTRAPLPKKKSQLPLLLGGAVVLAGLVLAVMYFMGSTEEKRRVAEEAEYAQPTAITAEALAKAWQADGPATDKQWKTKVLAVSGTVSRKQSVEGAYGAGLQHAVFLVGVEGLEIDCRIDPAHDAGVAALKQGDPAILVGRYAGPGAGNQALVLRGCRLR